MNHVLTYSLSRYLIHLEQLILHLYIRKNGSIVAFAAPSKCLGLLNLPNTKAQA